MNMKKELNEQCYDSHHNFFFTNFLYNCKDNMHVVESGIGVDGHFNNLNIFVENVITNMFL